MYMKLILALPAVSLVFSGLTSIPKAPHLPSANAPATPETPELWVEKNDCFKDESFVLHFASPHAATLGVIDPDGKFFYLVFPADKAIGNLKPLIASEQFVNLNALNITPALLSADPYTYGVLENQPVFTKSGTYRFVLGDNLHVDDDSNLHVVRIKYVHKKKPSGAAKEMIKN